MIARDVWEEQELFDRLLRTPPHEQSEAEVKEFIRDMFINLVSEGDELLRTTQWKGHRKARGHRPNREHRLEECIDLFKLWLCVVQGLGFSANELRDAFWRKSMVVRQRHSEEFVLQLDRPSAVIDIDNVLCDYTAGFCNWIINRAPLFAPAAQQLLARRAFFQSAADFGMTETEWQGFKHEFRSMGHKRFLPVMDGAKEFLERVRGAGLSIILLTSRPIDRYPNIYTDTLYWLQQHQLPYDHVWWALDKGERLIENGALKYVRLVVDDDPKYIAQFAKLMLPVFWLKTTEHPGTHIFTSGTVTPVSSLSQVVIP